MQKDLQKQKQSNMKSNHVNHRLCLPLIVTVADWLITTVSDSGMLTATLQVYSPESRTVADVMLSVLEVSVLLLVSSRMVMVEALASSCIPFRYQVN